MLTLRSLKLNIKYAKIIVKTFILFFRILLADFSFISPNKDVT